MLVIVILATLGIYAVIVLLVTLGTINQVLSLIHI